MTSAHRRRIVLWCVLATAPLSGFAQKDAQPGAEAIPIARKVLPFDTDWKFFKGDAPGAEAPAFQDTAWRSLAVPHDWSIEGPFDRNAPATGTGAFLPAGVGWYRKRFELPADFSGKRIFIEFDGVMANSDVWINGVLLGHRPYGYSGFRYELTGHVNFNVNFRSNANVLAVRADNSAQPASRFYAGAGIYRHVRLVVTHPVHFEFGSTVVTTQRIESTQALIRVRTRISNPTSAPQSISVHWRVGPPTQRPRGGDTKPFPGARGESAAQVIAANETGEFTADLAVPNPGLWSLDHPNLYRLLAYADAPPSRPSKSGAKESVLCDTDEVVFGIREARFDPSTGFWLNGENLKLKGVCLHNDASAFGMAVPDGAWERRLRALREIGVNAIRTAHNPPSPDFLDLCDQMGFLVMDEAFDCWTVAKNPFDYHVYFNEWSKIDARDMVIRDRNHPSVILWSAGNEIHDTPKTELAKGILSGLVEVFHSNDPTRPVTQALFRPNVSHDFEDGLADMLDVVGTNYRFGELLAAHEAKPSRKIVGTEDGHDLPSWLAVRDNPAYSGEFVWVGIDYLGESRVWPRFAESKGLLDRTAVPHPDGFAFQSWWTEKPMVWMARRVAPTRLNATDPGYETEVDAVARRWRQALFPDWTPRHPAANGESVEIYSNCETVELTLNGRSLGSKALGRDLAPRNWRVPFEAGSLRAVGRNRGSDVAFQELRTAGSPARLVVTTDTLQLAPGWDNFAVVTARVTDKDGVVVPDADPSVAFSVTGPAAVVAVDSADNGDPEPFQASARKAFQGRCIAIVRATAPSGSIIATAAAAGLESGSVSLSAKAR